MHFDVVSCVKVMHKSSQVDCNFLIAERKPENDSTGFKPVPARFFRALLKSKLLQRSRMKMSEEPEGFLGENRQTT